MKKGKLLVIFGGQLVFQLSVDDNGQVNERAWLALAKAGGEGGGTSQYRRWKYTFGINLPEY